MRYINNAIMLAAQHGFKYEAELFRVCPWCGRTLAKPHDKPPVKVINFFGGPGIGKSTTAAEVFQKMKLMQLNVELVTEYAKDVTWRGMTKVLQDELYVFAKQQHRIRMCSDQVEYIVTDSPLVLPLIYDRDNRACFKPLVMEVFNEYENYNFLLTRTKPYAAVGRSQTESQAREVDGEIENLLTELNLPYYRINTEEAWEQIRKVVLKE